MKALILGITGQDGAYLAQFLLGKGYTVYGTSRDVAGKQHSNSIALGIDDKIRLQIDINGIAKRTTR